MTSVNKYLNNLQLRIVIDDGKPGRVYILNPVKTSIYFIVDVDDSCLYINQNILNIYPEKEIEAFLQEIEVEMDIFPYFDDPSDIEDLKPSTQRYFELLMENITSIKIDFSEYNNSIFLFNKNNSFLQYNLKSDYFYVNYSSIWTKIQSKNEYSYIETQRIIKETVERHFKNRVTTPPTTYISSDAVVERHFKNRVTTPQSLSHQQNTLVERHFKNTTKITS